MFREIAERYKTHTPLDLAERAKVKQGTEISVLEYDLAPRGLIFRSYDWQKVLDKWLEKGAQIDLFIQALCNDSLRQTVDLMKKHPGFNIYDISKIGLGVDWGDNNRENLIDGFKDFHFALFKKPKQLWIERGHQPGKGYMRYCEYYGREGPGFSRQSMRDAPEWEKQFEKYERWIEIMKRNSKPLKVVR